MYTPVDVSAGGSFPLGGTGATGGFGGAAIKAGVDAATATFTAADGTFLGAVSAPLGLADSIVLPIPARYVSSVSVVVTGTAPKVVMYQA